MPKALQLSATTLSLFQDCPRCFWLHMRAGIKRPERPFPSITGGIDRLVQASCDATRPGFPRLLAMAMQEQIGTRLLAGAIALADPKIAYLRSHRENSIALVGRLDDVVFLAGGQAAPLDHKSRGSYPDSGYSAQYYQLQMDVYALLLQGNGYPVNAEAYLAYYYPVPEPGVPDAVGMPFGCTVEALAVSPARAETCYYAARACLASDCPLEPAVACAYCAWITNSLTYPLVR